MKKNYNNAISPYVLTDKDMLLIEKLSLKKLEKDEVFAFNVVLCDNEIDRDFERFDSDALCKLAELFDGKPGIFDHSMKGKDQTARIFEAHLEIDESKKTSAGESYKCLKAKAYMPITSKNEDLMAEINAGIKKEVSINCSLSERICSVCGKDVRFSQCEHVKGEKYRGEICHHVLKNPTDAYEWSFVAVPAQPKAGIVKSFKEKDERNMDNIFSVLKSCTDECTISKAQAEELCSQFDKLSLLAEDGMEYRKSLKQDVIRLSCTAMPMLSTSSIAGICDKLPLSELKKLKSDFEACTQSKSYTPQLSSEKSKNQILSNNEFKI